MDHINRSRPSLYSFLAGSQPLEKPSQGDRKPDQVRAPPPFRPRSLPLARIARGRVFEPTEG